MTPPPTGEELGAAQQKAGGLAGAGFVLRGWRPSYWSLAAIWLMA
jgi:hypothetical protein